MPIAAVSSDALDAERRGYPRPQLQRAFWYSLNGEWEFALDPEGLWSSADEVQWSGRIQIPFAPEAPLSGIDHRGYFRACWYRLRCDLPPCTPGECWLLHFGAVDWHATVWVNGSYVGEHEGGYTPFSFDVTALITGSACEIVLLAKDDPLDLAKPRGKQDWQLEPHSIWYPRTSGIWQTVWLERVPATRIGRVAYTADLTRWELGLEVWLEGLRRQDVRLAITLQSGSTTLASDTYQAVSGEVHRRIALSDPGVDDSRNDLLWSPHAPNLMSVHLQLLGSNGEVLDDVRSYAALRSASVQRDRFLLNGRPYLLRMVLDQGYWPDGGLTAPNDDALRHDVELARAMGFNGVRKHQKIEDPRYLYWADQIGLVVWAEMPSAYRFTRRSVERLSREWTAVISRDYSHPCIVSWVPINESWGVPNLPDNPHERHYVHALYHLTRTLDTTRPVVGNDGWESVATDIIGVHDYDDQPDRIAKRYHVDKVLPRLFKRERPAGRLLVLEGQADLPLMLTEFGGLAISRPHSGTWGYAVCRTREEFARTYERLLTTVNKLGLLAGFCYTQFSDTYQEANGLLYADRTPKIPIAQIARATTGSSHPHDAGRDEIERAGGPGEVR